MSHFVTPNLLDAADTLRMRPFDPDATSIYDLRGTQTPSYVGRSRTSARRRRIRQTQQEIAGLRDALAAGWDVGPELAFEERQLAALKASS
jgi:hypothetical protein